MTEKSPSRKRKTQSRKAAKKKRKKSAARSGRDAGAQNMGNFFLALAGDLTQGALELAKMTGGKPLSLAKTLLAEGGKATGLAGNKAGMMQEAGAYVRDLREVAGLTVEELGTALDMKDGDVLTKVEEGRAALPVETVLRMSALLARHDPLPFVIKLARSYNPDAWQLLENLGVGRVPVQFERERAFVNIYRGDDRARALSDDEFAKVLQFTRGAFEMAMEFAATHSAPAKD